MASSREIIYFYDGNENKDDNKTYKLAKRISHDDVLFLFYESVVETEADKLRLKIRELDDICENLMLTILDLTP